MLEVEQLLMKVVIIQVEVIKQIQQQDFVVDYVGTGDNGVSVSHGLGNLYHIGLCLRIEILHKLG